MKHDPVEHRERVLNLLHQRAEEKYNNGYREHGGDLLNKTPIELLYEIRDEAIDAFIYAQTAIDKLNAKTEDGKSKRILDSIRGDVVRDIKSGDVIYGIDGDFYIVTRGRL